MAFLSGNDKAPGVVPGALPWWSRVLVLRAVRQKAASASFSVVDGRMTASAFSSTGRK